jgi:FKBP-type peptidyl-prolyl cis-trans isomerase FkpA
MRSLFKLSLVAASISLITACGGEKAETKTDAKAETAAVAKTETKAAVPGAPTTELDKQSYGLGVSFGAYLKRALDENKKVEIVLNTEMVMNGVNDAVAGTEKLSKEEIEVVMKALDTMTREKHKEMAEKKKAEAVKAGTDFMAENAKKPGVKTTETGLQYAVVTEGKGEKPGPNDRVKVHYKGTLMDGTEFDSSYSRNQPAVFGVGQVIKGWTEGLQLMSVGSKFNFVIPSELAYGERATGKITPHSTLLFEVELLSIEEQGDDTAAPAAEKKGGHGHAH